jgi:hypothetical protein
LTGLSTAVAEPEKHRWREPASGPVSGRREVNRSATERRSYSTHVHLRAVV